MTVVPNLLIIRTLAIIVSLVFLVWVAIFVQRKHGGLVLFLLSLVMPPVGGFGPPLLGIILGVAATRINAPFRCWRTRESRGTRQFLIRLWPWSLAASVFAWLLLLPGSTLVDYVVGVINTERTMAMLLVSAFGLLQLAIVTGFVYDTQRQIEAKQTPTMSA